MILNHSYTGIQYSKSIITLRKVSLKNSSELKYLGSLVSSEPNIGDIEINHRIQLAQMKFASMTNLLQNRNISLRTKITFLNSFVRSRLVYSCQNWNPTTNQFEKIDIVYRQFLKRMIKGGYKRVEGDGEFRYKLNNKKVHSISSALR